MARYSPIGHLVTGVAGGPLQINRQPVGIGVGRWISDAVLITSEPESAPSGPWRLYFRAQSNNWARGLIQNSVGATTLAAGNWRWAATVEAPSGHVTTGSADLPALCKAAHAVDGFSDGTLVFRAEPATEALVWWPDGTVEQFHVGQTIHWDSARAVFGGFIYVADIDGKMQCVLQLRHEAARIILTFEHPYEPYSFVRGGSRWVLYHDSRTLVHPEGADVGHAFDAWYHPDIYPDGADVAGAIDEDGLGSIRVVGPFTLGEGMVPLALPLDIPTFAFDHDVTLAVFKDLDGSSGSPAEMVVNEMGQQVKRPYFVAEDSLDSRTKGELLGIYSEEAGDLSGVIKLADTHHTRLMLCHDSTTPWTVPADKLRKWDIPTRELYLSPQETLTQSVGRWKNDVLTTLGQWSGDIAVVPMFYTQNTFTIAQILDGLRHLPSIVNLSKRIKVIAPFAYSRANGITSNTDLQAAWWNLVAACPKLAVLTPVGDAPVPPIPPNPTPDHTFPLAKELPMDEYGPGIIFDCEFCDDPFKGPKFGRVDPNGPLDSGGNKVLIFDQDAPNDQTAIEVTKPDNYFQERFLASDVIITHLGAPDTIVPGSTKARCFETRPSGARGGSESPMIVEMPDKSGLILSTVPYLKPDGNWYWSMGLTLRRRP